MNDFDAPQIFFSDNFANDDPREDQLKLQSYKKKFKEFIRQFHEGNFNYKYRDLLKRNYNLKEYWIEINLEDVGAFDESLAEKIYKQPTEYLPVFEEAAKDVADELTAPRPIGEEKIQDIQILLSSDGHPTSLRGMKVIIQFSTNFINTDLLKRTNYFHYLFMYFSLISSPSW